MTTTDVDRRAAWAPPSVPKSPFVGLVPYRAEDAEWFFGRESDASLLADNLIAYELTLVYGPSGVGKSSLINAGVYDELRRQAHIEQDRGRRPFVTVVHREWSRDPIGDLVLSIDRAVAEQRPDVGVRPDPGASLTEQLRNWADLLEANVYIVLDQFEEYLLYHEHPDDPATIDLADAIAEVDDGTNFMIVMREDTLAKLDRFEERVPDLFENIYRIEHLDLTAAQHAVQAAVDHFNEVVRCDPAIEIEPELIGEVLSTVRTGNVVHHGVGVGRLEAAERRTTVETAQLQLVMARLWEEEIAAGGHVLRGGTLTRLGGAAEVIRRHLTEGMERLDPEEQRLALDVFQHLVTPSGSKIALAADDLAEYARVSRGELVPVLERLSQGDLRILRPVPPSADRPDVPRYEIFHDVLAAPILAWSAQRREDVRLAEADARVAIATAQARRDRRRLIFAGVGVVAVVALAAAAIFLWQRSEDERRQNESRELAAASLNMLQEDPAEAVAMAAAAIGASRTAEAESALRTSLSDLTVELVLSGHTDAVQTARFFPDGDRVVTASADGTARVWDASTGEQLVVMEGHSGVVWDARVSDDATRVLTSGDDKTVRVWDANSGSEVATIEPRYVVYQARLDPTGTMVVTSGEIDKVDVWDAGSGAFVRSLDHPVAEGAARVQAIEFATNGDETILATGDAAGVARVWDVATWESVELTELGAVSSLAISSDLDLITIGTWQYGSPWVWEWRSAQADLPGYLYLSQTHDATGVHTVAMSPSGDHVVASGDRTYQMWETQDVRAALDDGSAWVGGAVEMRGHVDWVTAVDWSPDSELLATGGNDGRIFVRDGHTGGFVADLRGHEGAINSLDFDTGQRLVSASNDRTARIWALEPAIVFRGHDGWVIDADISTTAGLLVSASADGTVRAFSLGDATNEWSIDHEGEAGWLGFLNAVDLTDDARHVAAGGDGWKVSVWEVPTVRDEQPPLLRERQVNGTVIDLAFSPDGETLAASVATGAIHLWRWNSDEPVRTLIGHRLGAWVSFDPNGTLLASGGGEGGVRIWDVATGSLIDEFDAHQGGVTGIDFSPDGSLIITSGQDRTIRLWEARSRTQIAELTGHDYPVTGAHFDPPGERIVSGDKGGFVAVWDVEDRALLSLVRKHDVYVNDVAFADGQRIVSAGDDDVVRMYECTTCAPVDDLLSSVESRLEKLPEAQSRTGGPTTFGSDIAPGTCTLAPADLADFDRLTPVDCTEEHAYEFFASFDHAAGPDVSYPGEEEVHRVAQTVCEAEVDSYVGGGLPAGTEVTTFTSTEPAWASGSRTIKCAFISVDGSPLIGSVRDDG